MTRFQCQGCGATEPLIGVSPSDFPVMPQAVAINCHKCSTPHRLVDSKWAKVPAQEDSQ